MEHLRRTMDTFIQATCQTTKNCRIVRTSIEREEDAQTGEITLTHRVVFIPGKKKPEVKPEPAPLKLRDAA